MTLQLTLVKAPEGVSLSSNARSFSEVGGTLGRADGNTWVLPDPEKFLSSCHCEVLFDGGIFFLYDRSTNGTFINGASEPIGRGSKVALAHGDFFEVGDYRFSVAVANNQVAGFGSPFDTPASKSPLHNVAPSLEDIFQSPHVSGPSDIFGQQVDPLALWDHAGPNAASYQASSPFFESNFASSGAHLAPVKSESVSALDAFLGVSAPEPSNQAFASVDMTPSTDQSIAWPSASQESLIPEDWAEDLLPPSRPPAAFEVFSPERAPRTSPTPVPVAKTERIPLADRLAMLNEPAPAAPTTIEPMPQVEALAKQISSASTRPSDGKNSVLVDALGLDKTRLSAEDVVEVERLTGLLMREIVDGMLGVLRSRANIKNEFRMNVTTIQPVENNPLKFSVGVDDALENIFLKKSKAFKRPVEAFREGFQEMAEHQLAMIAGIRAGFDSLMDRFEPEKLELGFSKQAKMSVLPGLHKAKYWSSYRDFYQGLSDNMDHSFQYLFGGEFVSAYEDQLRRLASNRKKENSDEK